MHIVPVGKESPNMIVVYQAKQLGTKYGYFFPDLTLFALVSIKASDVQGTEAEHAKAMVQAATTCSSLFRRRDPPH